VFSLSSPDRLSGLFISAFIAHPLLDGDFLGFQPRVDVTGVEINAAPNFD